MWKQNVKASVFKLQNNLIIWTLKKRSVVSSGVAAGGSLPALTSVSSADFHRCNKALSSKDQDTAPCDWYQRVYKSLCPISWVSHTNAPEKIHMEESASDFSSSGCIFMHLWWLCQVFFSFLPVNINISIPPHVPLCLFFLSPAGSEVGRAAGGRFVPRKDLIQHVLPPSLHTLLRPAVIMWSIFSVCTEAT